MNWISIYKKMPPTGKVVLTAQWVLGESDPWLYETALWDGSDWHGADDPIKWMEIPVPRYSRKANRES
jgi:hypothetical protein